MNQPRILPDWVFEWANGDNDEKRMEATRIIQEYIHALPETVRDAIKDDLQARDEQEPKKFALVSRSSHAKWWIVGEEATIRLDFERFRDQDKETYLCVVLDEGKTQAYYERQRQAEEERKKRHKNAH